MRIGKRIGKNFSTSIKGRRKERLNCKQRKMTKTKYNVR